MESSLYEGSHKELFEVFLKLVDDYDAQTAALLDLTSWDTTSSLLSVGGGEGIVEATLLRNAPKAKVWYLDPSPEQCQAFRRHMKREHLLERVEDVSQTTFQEYNTQRRFDRIVSMFSWFFVGTSRRWLVKLIDLLNPNGTACLVLPNTESIEADLNRSMSPDKRTTLVGDEVAKALRALECSVRQHTYTKWLAIDELFEGEFASEASLAFAAFIAMRPITTFTPAEKRHVVDLLNVRREGKGVPLRWDVIVVKPGSS
ncbi:MAG: class I SAM-dependent methyltransferase [Chloroflexota bacterium]|nr:MAG: class I SAM-dependent methyltransferase [Chloroflexota bacterium]